MVTRTSMTRRWALKLGLGAAAGSTLGARDLLAQSGFPDRNIRLIVPFPAGGAYDTVARPLAQRMGQELGRSVIVENKPGGETSIACVEVARSPADGYSLLFGGSPTHVFAPATMAHPPYNPQRDFAQVAVTGVIPMSIAVNPKFPAKTLQDLIQMAQEKPGVLNYADPAGSSRVVMELLKSRLNLDIVGVPYKGGAPALNDLIAGHIQIYPAVAGSVARMHRENVVRVLAIVGDRRVRAMPEVPTAAEAGVPDFAIYSFNIVSAPAGTPAPVVEILSKTIRKILNEPAMIALQEASGIEPVLDSTPEKATAFVNEQIEKLTPIIKAAERKK